MNALMISAMPTLFSLLVKATALLLGAWLICLCLRRTSAAVRHLVWIAALSGILLLPVLSTALPRWNVAVGHAAEIPVVATVQAVPTASITSSTLSALEGVSSEDAQSVSVRQQTAGEETSSAAQDITAKLQSSNSYSIGSYLFLVFATGSLIWLIGFIAVLLQFFVGLRRIGEVRHQSLSLENLPRAVAEEVCRTFRSDYVDFLQAKAQSAVAVPVTWGLHRPTVLLPAKSASWSEDCLRAALLHELAHVQRRDWLTQTVAHFICALYWWHPLVWLAAKHAREESEQACDDLVLGAGMTATDYAQRLVEVVRSLPAGASTRSVAVAMAEPSEVERRVKAVLATGKDRTHLSQKQLAFTAVIGFMLLPLSTLQPVMRAAADSQARLASDKFKGHPVIVVDPGHGGLDTGAVGAGGVTEKTLNLEIAHQLRAELERRGAIVFLTRDADTTLSISGRPQIGAQRHADYFVSLHCDVWNNRPDQVAQKSEATGTAVYFHGQNPKQQRLAQSIGLGIGQATALSPSKVASDTTRFVKGFGVLREAQMPAVLVECGYMNFPQGLDRLQNPRQQQRLAEGIAAGLVAVQVQD